jgi:AhpD family alkylhydroperoxidase
MSQISNNAMSYPEQTKHIKKYTSQIRTALPEVMKAFYSLSKNASTSGALDAKTKELIALAIGVATHCNNCIAFHTQAALKAGASRDEIMETLGVNIYMGGGPSLMYAAHVVETIEQFEQLDV